MALPRVKLMPARPGFLELAEALALRAERAADVRRSVADMVELGLEAFLNVVVNVSG